MPTSDKAQVLLGLFVRRRTRLTPRSQRIAAGKLKSLQSALNPSAWLLQRCRCRHLAVRMPAASPSSLCRGPPDIRRSTSRGLLRRSPAWPWQVDRRNRSAASPALRRCNTASGYAAGARPRQIAHDESQRGFNSLRSARERALEPDGMEHAPLGGHACGRNAPKETGLRSHLHSRLFAIQISAHIPEATYAVASNALFLCFWDGAARVQGRRFRPH